MLLKGIFPGFLLSSMNQVEASMGAFIDLVVVILMRGPFCTVLRG